MRNLSFSGVLLCAACTAPATVEDNDLDIATLQTHVTADTFELDALDAHGDSVATVTRRIGAIEDLVPGRTDTIGSEIVISVGSETTRGITFETQLLALAPMDAPFADFLALPSVASALEREGKMQVYVEPTVTAPTAEDSAYSTSLCPASKLVANGVTAQQCCYATASSWKRGHTMFRRASTGEVSYREEGPTCADASGNKTCQFVGDGSGCTYGPNGFSKAQFWKRNNYVRIAPNITTGLPSSGQPPSYTLCTDTWSGSPLSAYYGNVTGTSPVASCGREPSYIWGY